MADPPTLWDIETDPVLAGTKLIAEAWDAGGLYQVGSFVGDRWVEWNGRFRDDVRCFVKGDPGTARSVALRFLGSPDIYGTREREPQVSLNFVTCHDGFTLNDLVSYDDQAQRGQRRGEPRRQRPEPELELRRRGADRRSGHRRPAPAPDQEPPDARPARPRRPDAAHGRRGPPDPGRQQQRLLPRRRDRPGSTGRSWSATPSILRFTHGADSPAAAVRRRDGPSGRARPGRHPPRRRHRVERGRASASPTSTTTRTASR